MRWQEQPLLKVAPPKAATLEFPSSQAVWHLTLDQIESHTGRVIRKQIAPAGEAGTSTFVFDQGNVLYSKLRPYLNKVIHPTEPGIATSELVPLKPNPSLLLPDFLAYYLRSPLFLAFASSCVAGAKMPRVIMSKFWEHIVPIPPISEQCRIVEILDQADSFRKLRAEADTKADRILTALFIKIFGDPVTNPKGWPEMPLREVIASVDAGWSMKAGNRRCLPEEFGVLKVSAVTTGLFREDANKVLSTIDEQKELISPRRGDLLFSRANTRELVAASCIVEEDAPRRFLPDKLWRIIPKPNRVSAPFLRELFWVPGFRDRFRVNATGTSGSMLNISQEAFLSTPAPIPPWNLQEEFASIAWKQYSIRQLLRAQVAKADSLWVELHRRAFSGDLTAAWRQAHVKELSQEMQHQSHCLSETSKPETVA